VGANEDAALELFVRVHGCTSGSGCLATLSPDDHGIPWDGGTLLGVALSAMDALGARRRGPPRPRRVFVGRRGSVDLVIVQAEANREGGLCPGPVVEAAPLSLVALGQVRGEVVLHVPSGTISELDPADIVDQIRAALANAQR
jgi:hypothetical protein